MNIHFVWCGSRDNKYVRHPLVTIGDTTRTGCALCRLYEHNAALRTTIETAIELLAEGKQIQADRALQFGLDSFKVAQHTPINENEP